MPEVVHIDSFWVGVCLKTKPPVGVPGSETFVDKVPAEPNDWLVSIRVTGLATEAAREMVMAKIIPHFEMYLNEELNKVQDSLHVEQKTREDSENSLIRVLEDMCQKMQHEVQLERKDRESTEEIFLKLLEETCDRVQSGLKP